MHYYTFREDPCRDAGTTPNTLYIMSERLEKEKLWLE